MNSIMNQFSGLLQQNHAVRDQIWEVINDSDLKHSLGGNTLTLGGLCKEMGEVEYAYIQSFKTFRQDFSYRCADAGLDTSVERLRAWFKTLDAELNAALNDLSEDDIQTRTVRRDEGDLPVSTNFHFYREGLLMFCARASLYLKSLRIAMPEPLNSWVG